MQVFLNNLKLEEFTNLKTYLETKVLLPYSLLPTEDEWREIVNA